MQYFRRHSVISRLIAALLSVIFYLVSFDQVLFAQSIKQQVVDEYLGKQPQQPRQSDFSGDARTDLTDVTYAEANTREEKFAPGQAKKIAHEEAELEIGADALDEERLLSITPLRDLSLKPLNPGMVNVTKKHKGFRFLPSGKFKNPIKVKLPYDRHLVSEAGATEDEVLTFFFDEDAGLWKPLERVAVDKQSGKVESRTDHFTDMINAVVTVPDSPESVNFNPTQIKGIKAANPGANINLIEPPQANNMGSANLSYPIEVPPGRLGLQPQLAIQYNSDGGNGWLGLGWDLPMQAVSIDTRWGAPRYDEALETETYVLSGQQLTPVAHRTNLVPRMSEKVFRSRIEGAFNLIIRHGDSPQNYWWEVKDKNGNASYYGGTPEDGQIREAVLSACTDQLADCTDKPVFKWALVEMRDTNGNNMRYRYVTVTDTGIGKGSDPGSFPWFELYLKTILYTGHNENDGLYKVEFIRECELISCEKPEVEGIYYLRPDVMLDARGGFKKLTGDRLKRIEISFDSQPVRSYELNYTEGAFKKTLLSSITQFGEDGAEFHTHTFVYYDEARNAANDYKGFADKNHWDTGDDNVEGGIFDYGDASAISGSETESVGGHLYLGISIGSCSKDLSVGGKVGFNQSTSEGLLALIDINADGLQDKVFKDGGSYSYRPNLSGPDGGTTFGAKRGIATLPDISKEKSQMTSGGGEIYVGAKGLNAWIGINKSSTHSEAPVYFSDVNGDGLPDLVHYGLVLFNHLDADGHPVFTSNSAETPNPVGQGAVDTNNLIEDYEKEYQNLIDTFPLLDAVKSWTVPFDGRIRITGNVALLEDTSEKRSQYETADGVRVAVQHNSSELWTTEIGATDYLPKTPTGLNSIAVKKGDVIYFRVQSIFDGAYDQVAWNPEIVYLDVEPAYNANNLDEYHYNASEDFLLAAQNGATVVMPVDGTVRLEAEFEKFGQTTDDLTVTILRNDTQVVTETLSWDETRMLAVSQEVQVTAQDHVSMYVEIDSPIDLKQVRWNKSRLYYTESETIETPFDENGNPTVEIDLFASYDLYPVSGREIPLTPWKVPVDGIYTVKPNIGLPVGDTETNGELIVTVKKHGERIAKQPVTITNGMIDVDEFTIEARQDDELFFEFSTREPELEEKLLQHEIEAIWTKSLPDVSPVPAPPVQLVYEVESEFHSAAKQTVLGSPYRGWTVFGYDGNRDRATSPIIITEEDLNPYAQFNEDTYEDYKTRIQEGTFDPKEMQMKLSPFYPDMAKSRLQSMDEDAWAKEDVLGSSRNGLNFISVPLAQQFAELRAVTRLSSTSQLALSIGAGGSAGGFSISGSASSSESTTRSSVDFLDMNGDRYPDIVSSGGIQYTWPTGGLEPSKRASTPEGDVRKTEAESVSFGVGGNYSYNIGKASGNSSHSSQQMVPLGVSGNVSKGESDTIFDFMDVNADGLPDRVKAQGGGLAVSLNLGYGFAPYETWGSNQINHNDNENGSLGATIGFNDGIYGFGGGLNLSRGSSESEYTLSDINGDGLLDAVRASGGKFYVILNTGNGFNHNMEYPTPIDDLSASTNTSLGGGVYFTLSIPIGIPPVVICIIINPGADYSSSVGKAETGMIDIDGDSYPDVLQSDSDNFLKAGINQIGRTNLLKTVHRPLGATISLEYERNGNTYEQPHSHWDLSRVEMHDGHAGDGVDTLLTTYTYQDGFYNRQEREFYGYRTVVEEQRDSRDESLYRSITRVFQNDSYYAKGLLLSETLADAQGNKYTETRNEYLLYDVDSGTLLLEPNHLTATVFPQLRRVDKLFYEGGFMAQKLTHETYEYDEFGNVTGFFDAGDMGAADDVQAVISYHKDLAHYIVGKANTIEVSSNGSLYRKREAEFESGTGNLRQVRQYLESGAAAITDLSYDQYGNIATVTGQANYKGERYQLSYAYDPTVFTHNISVLDSFGYESTADYNLKYGAVARTTDLNNNSIVYTYDNFGRVSAITGPYQTGSGLATITFEYHPEADVPYALTQHLDVYRDPKDPIETVLFIDGLTRVIQTKKDGTIHQNENAQAKDMVIVSGHSAFDFVGRAIEQYYPVTEPLGEKRVFNPEIDTIRPTVTTYDVLDRTLSVTIPDLTSTTMSYGFGVDRNNQIQFRTRVTDANGVAKETYRDVKGQITAVKEFNEGGSQILLTSYEYDPLSQIVKVLDDHSNETKVSYDNLGRRTVIDSPDAGVTESVYDLASNVVQKITSNLRAEGKAIEYDYTYLRLNSISYPDFTENNVTYSYGAPGADFNRANRIVTVTDESGKEERFYGPLGETVKTIKTVNSDTQGNSANSPEVYVTEYTFDTWNRLQRLVYPDGEVLTNYYDSGGLLREAYGEKDGWTYDYLNRLEYDKFSQRVFMEQGNGIRTKYAYNAENRRLISLKAGGDTKSAPQHSRALFQDLVYSYDKVGNILGLQNLAGVTSANQMGGTTSYSYQYDDLYRLTQAQGTYHFESNKVRSFTLDMAYDSIHNIVSKNQQDWITQPGGSEIPQFKTSYDWRYAYAGSQPHAPTHIGDRAFSYDANGNQSGWEHDQNGTRRTITWDEENRIREIGDNGHTMTYKYNDAGERVIKSGPQGETAYINQFFSIRNREVGTKHIYAGTVRVVSKMMKQAKPGTNTSSPAQNSDSEKTNNGNNADKEKTNQKDKNLPQGSDKGQGKKTGIIDNNGQNKDNKGGGTSNNPHKRPEELDLYFFHPDHLGSTAYVTDADGEIYQHLEYFPFGETWVEESANTQRTPYLFTAKELDEETQLYYFGARYYDPRTNVWQSPDPILGAYLPTINTSLKDLKGAGGVYNSFNLNLYHYGALNPVKYIDPDGNSFKSFMQVLGGSVLIGMGYVVAAASILVTTTGHVYVCPYGMTAATGMIAYGGAMIVDAANSDYNERYQTKPLTIPLDIPSFERTKDDDDNSRIPLYRSVGDEEAQLIESSGGRFFPSPGGLESKYFSLTEEGARQYGKGAQKSFGEGTQTIFATTFPKKEITPDMMATVDRGIPAVAIPNEKLHLLSPAINRGKMHPEE